MSFEFSNDIPIYLQIIDNIKMRIISQKYMPSERLPSVRELSLEYEVNPNTIQKALFELEACGLIYTERTNGKFVTQNIAIIEKIKNETINKMVKEFFISMEKIGMTKDDVIDVIENAEKKGML